MFYRFYFFQEIDCKKNFYYNYVYVKFTMLKALFRGKGVLEKHVLVRKIKCCTVVYFVDDTILKNNILFAKRGIKKELFTYMQLFAGFFFLSFFWSYFSCGKLFSSTFIKIKVAKAGKLNNFHCPYIKEIFI